MIKTKLGTRMFSVLMVLTMLLSLLPMTAFAKSSKNNAVTLAEGTYTFSNCKEYPTLLADSAKLEGYWDVPLTLDIQIIEYPDAGRRIY